jgi:UPF0755 protein
MRVLPLHGLRYLALGLLGLVLALLIWMWQLQQELFSTPIQRHQLLTLPNHSSASKFADILVQQGILKHRRFFLWMIQFKQMSYALKSGTYNIEPNDTIWVLVKKITKGQVYSISFKIIEGSRWCDLLHQMRKEKTIQFSEAMLEQLPNQISLEGMFYPSTYQQPYGASILPVLKLAYDTLQQRLNQVWLERDYDLPYHNAYELLVAASIIEKETADGQERRMISGVIVNRLKLNMPLQMDPTVAYGISSCQHLILKGADLKQDSPYNSYLHRGLPPTPIAMVSQSSLLAAAHPIRSSYLYFVAKGDGHHVFSVDYHSQKKAINQFLRKVK